MSVKFFRAAAFNFVLCGLVMPCPVMCADIVLEKNYGKGTVDISFTGDITPGDDVVFSTLAKNAKQLFLKIESNGGDVDTAVRIGTVVRKHAGFVSSEGCYSAYMLIVAGGVIRTRTPLGGEPVVGVHRIFFADLQPGLSADQVKARYDAQLKRVRNYLAEMNVAPELLSFMQSINPDDIHVLTAVELSRYGLGPRDPIYDERMVADRAAELGISSLEYRVRENRGREECKDENGTSEEQSIRLRVNCAMAIHYGTSIETYRERSAEVHDKCVRYTDQNQQNRCEVHFMTTGRAVP